jgi:hypothetical protein
MAHSIDPIREATARAAAKAGMTVEAWIAHTDRLEAAHNARRRTEQMMQQVPRYRDEDAA